MYYKTIGLLHILEKFTDTNKVDFYLQEFSVEHLKAPSNF